MDSTLYEKEICQKPGCQDEQHLHYYDGEELNDLNNSQKRSVSLTKLDDSTVEDLWNLTLDDLEEAQMRRRSDGMMSKKSLPRNVSFGKVHVRVCERVLGDNPACHGGPSLSIGWNYDATQEVQVDDWELKRSKQGPLIALSASKREKIAKRSGFTKEEIQKNVEKNAKYQRRRERTRKEVEKDSKTTLLSHSKQKSLARFLRDRASRPTRSGSLRSMRS